MPFEEVEIHLLDILHDHVRRSRRRPVVHEHLRMSSAITHKHILPYHNWQSFDRQYPRSRVNHSIATKHAFVDHENTQENAAHSLFRERGITRGGAKTHVHAHFLISDSVFVALIT
jgi:hypothetical protein